MTQPTLSTLVKTGDIAAVRGVLETQSVRDTDVSWAMMRCIEFKQREILDVLLSHTRTHLRPAPDFFAGPLAWAAGQEEDTALFEHILKDSPSHFKALSNTLTHLMRKEKDGANEQVMRQFELWCEKADVGSLQEALSSVVVWNLPRFLSQMYPKWMALASEEKISSELFKNLTHCFSWGEGQQGATLRHPEIYDFLLAQISSSRAQQYLDKMEYDKNLDHFQYLPGRSEIYAILEPVLHSVVQNEVLKNSVQECATTPSLVRKM